MRLLPQWVVATTTFGVDEVPAAGDGLCGYGYGSCGYFCGWWPVRLRLRLQWLLPLATAMDAMATGGCGCFYVLSLLLLAADATATATATPASVGGCGCQCYDPCGCNECRQLLFWLATRDGCRHDRDYIE